MSFWRPEYANMGGLGDPTARYPQERTVEVTKRERHSTSGKVILNKPDEAGFYTCQYTSLKVRIEDAIYLGPCTPQVSGTYVCHPAALPAFRKSKREFDSHDANCNTCQSLERVPHEKRKDGQMLGRCHLSESLKFHPDDYMGMPCYTQRLEKT